MEYCPECFGPPVEEKGVYYCSRCGLVIGQVIYYGASPARKPLWNSSLQAHIFACSDSTTPEVRYRANYIARKLQKAYDVSPKLAAVAGLIAASRELGVKGRIRAPKSTVRRAKILLWRSMKDGVIQLKEKKTDIFAEKLRVQCTALGIPIKEAMEIYERHQHLLSPHKPSTVALAVGYMLGLNLPKKRAAAKLARELSTAEALHRGVVGVANSMPERRVMELEEGTY